MLYVLWGPDAYRLLSRRREIVRGIQKAAAVPAEHFDLEEKEDSDRLADFVRSQSIFTPQKIALIQNPFAVSKKEYKSLLQDHHQAKNIHLLLLSETKPPKPFHFLLPQAEEFALLSGPAWIKFIQAEAKSRGLAIEPAARNLLAAAFAGDSFRLATELDKLSAGEPVVSVKSIKHLVGELTPNFWATLNGLKHPDLRLRLKTLEELLARNESAGKIFNILAYQWPEKTAAFAVYDGAVKSGKCDYEEVLLDLVTSN